MIEPWLRLPTRFDDSATDLGVAHLLDAYFRFESAFNLWTAKDAPSLMFCVGPLTHLEPQLQHIRDSASPGTVVRGATFPRSIERDISGSLITVEKNRFLFLDETGLFISGSSLRGEPAGTTIRDWVHLGGAFASWSAATYESWPLASEVEFVMSLTNAENVCLRGHQGMVEHEPCVEGQVTRRWRGSVAELAKDPDGPVLELAVGLAAAFDARIDVDRLRSGYIRE